jgi:hypothetical protein
MKGERMSVKVKQLFWSSNKKHIFCLVPPWVLGTSASNPDVFYDREV